MCCPHIPCCGCGWEPVKQKEDKKAEDVKIGGVEWELIKAFEKEETKEEEEKKEEEKGEVAEKEEEKKEEKKEEEAKGEEVEKEEAEKVETVKKEEKADVADIKTEEKKEVEKEKNADVAAEKDEVAKKEKKEAWLDLLLSLGKRMEGKVCKTIITIGSGRNMETQDVFYQPLRLPRLEARAKEFVDAVINSIYRIYDHVPHPIMLNFVFEPRDESHGKISTNICLRGVKGNRESLVEKFNKAIEDDAKEKSKEEKEKEITAAIESFCECVKEDARGRPESINAKIHTNEINFRVVDGEDLVEPLVQWVRGYLLMREQYNKSDKKQFGTILTLTAFPHESTLEIAC